MTVIDITPDAQGKVRDVYDLGDKLLMVATDRISAFDYILEDEIPYKGQVLTQLSKFWFELLDGVVENHLISTDVEDLPEEFQPYADYLRGRFMLVKKAEMFPTECIVRGYLAGSGSKVCKILRSCQSPSSLLQRRQKLAITTRTFPSNAAPRSLVTKQLPHCATSQLPYTKRLVTTLLNKGLSLPIQSLSSVLLMAKSFWLTKC